jgi:hypothetical protein
MLARGKHGPPKFRLDPVNTRKNERGAEALLARRRDAQGRCRPAPFFCARIPTLAKTRGQVFFLHVEMMLMEGLCCKDDRRRWEDGDKLDPISFMRRYRKER